MRSEPDWDTCVVLEVRMLTASRLLFGKSHHIQISGLLQSGCEAARSSRTGEPVHLQQGEADGACGHYCVLMALLALGEIEHKQATNFFTVKRSSRLGRLAKYVQEAGEDYFHGTDVEQLAEMVAAGFSACVVTASHVDGGKSTRAFVEQHLDLGHLVITMLDFGSRGSHWVLAIGIEDSRRGKRLLVIDPGAPANPTACWNGTVALTGTGGKLPYVGTLAGEDVPLAFGTCLAIWPASWGADE